MQAKENRKEEQLRAAARAAAKAAAANLVTYFADDAPSLKPANTGGWGGQTVVNAVGKVVWGDEDSGAADKESESLGEVTAGLAGQE
ncbi:hypothetical protein WJX81_002945, partial [Elliptochloris bilobata]